jgi:membrane-bound metal-dependent hydrolase YbcI (DUF457 family)
MASPVFHGLAGAGLAYVLAGDGRLPLWASLRQSAGWLAGGAVLACLPDVDYLPGLLRGYLNTTHQQATHSAVWVLLAAAGIWLAGRAWRPERFHLRALVFLLTLIGSHLAIDLVTADHFAPYGIPLWAPFSAARVRLPAVLLPAWSKTALADLGQGRNLLALLIELGAGGACLAAGVWAKRSWTRRRSAL